MVKTWSENKKLLEEIVLEMVINKSNQHHHSEIMRFYQTTLDNVYKKQYSFQNYTELNKHVLSELNDYVKTLDTNTASQSTTTGTPPINLRNTPSMFNNISETNYGNGRNSVTREGIHKERDNLFKQRMREKQNERDEYNKKPVKEIDFTDKNDENAESIDNLLEKELARRNQEITYNPSQQEKANEWIYNTDPSLLHTGNSNTIPNMTPGNTFENEGPPKLKIHNSEIPDLSVVSSKISSTSSDNSGSSGNNSGTSGHHNSPTTSLDDLKPTVNVERDIHLSVIGTSVDKEGKKVHFDTTVHPLPNSSEPSPVVPNNLLLKLKQIKDNRQKALDNAKKQHQQQSIKGQTMKGQPIGSKKSDENKVIHPSNMVTNSPLYNQSEVLKQLAEMKNELTDLKSILYRVLQFVSKEEENITFETKQIEKDSEDHDVDENEEDSQDESDSQTSSD